MLSEKITKARVDAGLNLSQLCRRSGVTYNTLYQQIERGSAIPFETVDAIAQALDVPLDYFSSRPRYQDASVAIAKQISEAAARIAGQAADPGLDVGAFWDRLNAADFSLEKLGDAVDYLDIYEPVRPEAEVADPCSFGPKSLARTHLKIRGVGDYYPRVAKFSQGLRQRALSSHIRAETEAFQVAPEVIEEQIEGQTVYGCYLRATARLRDASGALKNAVLTQYVTAFPDQRAV